MSHSSTLVTPVEITGTVKRYPYRTARVVSPFMTLPFDSSNRDDSLVRMEEKLADLAGVRPDNHVVYEITSNDPARPTTLYISYSDLRVEFSYKIREGAW